MSLFITWCQNNYSLNHVINLHITNHLPLTLRFWAYRYIHPLLKKNIECELNWIELNWTELNRNEIELKLSLVWWPVGFGWGSDTTFFQPNPTRPDPTRPQNPVSPPTVGPGHPELNSPGLGQELDPPQCQPVGLCPDQPVGPKILGSNPENLCTVWAEISSVRVPTDTSTVTYACPSRSHDPVETRTPNPGPTRPDRRGVTPGPTGPKPVGRGGALCSNPTLPNPTLGLDAPELGVQPDGQPLIQVTYTYKSKIKVVKSFHYSFLHVTS